MADNMYSVYVEAQAPPGAHPAVDDGAADDLMDLLEDHSGVVAAGESSWSATVSIPAEDVHSATAKGTVLVEALAAQAGMPSWPLTRSETLRQDVLEAQNARPTLPEIVSVPEAADILGVSQQRVRELAATQKGFPEPVYELRTGKLWLRAAMEAYAARRSRKPGRPAASSAADLEARASLHAEAYWRSDSRQDAVQVYVMAFDHTQPLQQAVSVWKASRPAAEVPAIRDCLAGLWSDAQHDDVKALEHVLGRLDRASR